jgi:hypothetical protein
VIVANWFLTTDYADFHKIPVFISFSLFYVNLVVLYKLAKNLPEKIHETKDYNHYDQCYDDIGQQFNEQPHDAQKNEDAQQE